MVVQHRELSGRNGYATLEVDGAEWSCNLGGSVKRVSAGCVNRESTDVPQSVVAALSQLHRVQRASEALYMCACVLNKRWFQ